MMNRLWNFHSSSVEICFSLPWVQIFSKCHETLSFLNKKMTYIFDVAASNIITTHSMQLYQIFVKIKMSSMSRLLIIQSFCIHYGNFPTFWLNTSLNWWNQFHYHATIHKQIILSAFFIIFISNVFDFRFHSQINKWNEMN